MNNLDDFTKAGHSMMEWLHRYFTEIEQLPVKPNIRPGSIEALLPKSAPQKGETFERIIQDFDGIIMPGITHWQHPGFHAYFPANNSYPSVLAELLSAGLGVQGMKWITSPAATELERVMMVWLRELIALPEAFKGVIMDTASVSTLCAILAAREKITGYSVNENGHDGRKYRVYCSSEAHSSIEKAVRIAGLGSKNLVKIQVDGDFKMITKKLEEAILSDLQMGFVPTCIVGALGTTGSGSIDKLDEIGQIANRYHIWYHIDAAYSGNALILPEFRKSIKGLESADSLVFNPHKWLFTNFDCSAFFVKNQEDLTRTFSLVPAYLQSAESDDLDYSNWGIQLGRRFRSLKLWFVIRSFGAEGLQSMLRFHIELGKMFETFVLQTPDFELLIPRNLNIVCFRYCKGEASQLNGLNQALLEKINATGKIYLSHTLINNNFALRFVCGQTRVAERHITEAWKIISKAAEGLNKKK